MITGQTSSVPLYSLRTQNGAQVYRNGAYTLREGVGYPVQSIDAPCGHYARLTANRAASHLGLPVHWVFNRLINIPKDQSL